MYLYCMCEQMSLGKTVLLFLSIWNTFLSGLYYIVQCTGLSNDNQTVMIKMSSSYHMKTSEDRNPFTYGLKRPDHTCDHAFLVFIFNV